MVIVAHPGDEAFGFAGAIASAAAEGAYVVVVCATRGYFDPRITAKPPAPGGRNRDLLDPLGWRNLDTVREDEMRRSAALLGVNVLRMLDYAEGDLATVDYHHLVGRLVEPIRMHQPEVVLTFGPDGVTGDTDHVTLSRAVGDAVQSGRRAARLRVRPRGGPGRLADREAVPPRRPGRGARRARADGSRRRVRIQRRSHRPWTSPSGSWSRSSWPPSSGTCPRPAPTARSPAGTPIAGTRGWPMSTTASRCRTSRPAAATEGESVRRPVLIGLA